MIENASVVEQAAFAVTEVLSKLRDPTPPSEGGGHARNLDELAARIDALNQAAAVFIAMVAQVNGPEQVPVTKMIADYEAMIYKALANRNVVKQSVNH